jgi:hypothetical protein
MSIIIRIAIEDDETFFTPEKYQILPILIFLCGSAKKTTGVLLTEDELLSPGCPEFFQVILLFLARVYRLRRSL